MKDDKQAEPGLASEQQDLTSRLAQAEQDLANQAEKYNKLFEQSNDGIYLHDLEGNIIDANKRAAEQLGYLQSEMMALKVFAIHPPEVMEQSKAAFAAIQKEGRVHFEITFKKKDGTLFPAEVSASMFELSGKTVVQGLVRDVSRRQEAEQERRQLEQQIQKAQKMESLGVLAGGIAHDFNNLLMGVLGNVDLALLDTAPESPATPRLRDIRTTAIRLSELTNQMLAYSGKGKFIVEPVDLSRMVSEMEHLLAVTTSKKVVIKYELIPDLPAVEADTSQLRQVIMNLISNAAEAIGSSSGVVSVRTGVADVDSKYLADTFLNDELEKGCYVFLEVSDTGCGMDTETREKIFDPFFSTKFAGRGLGLAAVIGIIRGHGGAIKVYSEPSRGSTFKVLLPCSEKQVPLADAKNRPINIAHGRGRVLVVDDEETVRAVARMMLEKLGFEVRTACDGQEAVELLETQEDLVDIVLLDLAMPRKDGVETFREIRRIHSDLPVILSSGYNEQDATSYFAGKGLAGFIQKPYEVQTLMQKLSAVLNQQE